jgi:hypothetical protein
MLAPPNGLRKILKYQNAAPPRNAANIIIVAVTFGAEDEVLVSLKAKGSVWLALSGIVTWESCLPLAVTTTECSPGFRLV